MSSNVPGRPAYVLNTRPVLNLLTVDRLDFFTNALGVIAYVSPTVLAEVRTHVDWTGRDLRRRLNRSPRTVDPNEAAYIAQLTKSVRTLGPPQVNLIKQIELAELVLAAKFMGRGDLDPGESEVLAIARNRGWVAVIDEFRGHRRAETEGIKNNSTLGLLVWAVKDGRIGYDEGARFWETIQRWWDYAPNLSLAAYVGGRPIWSPRHK